MTQQAKRSITEKLRTYQQDPANYAGSAAVTKPPDPKPDPNKGGTSEQENRHDDRNDQ